MSALIPNALDAPVPAEFIVSLEHFSDMVKHMPLSYLREFIAKAAAIENFEQASLGKKELDFRAE